jgi:hypothetical protein
VKFTVLGPGPVHRLADSEGLGMGAGEFGELMARLDIRLRVDPAKYGVALLLIAHG